MLKYKLEPRYLSDNKRKDKEQNIQHFVNFCFAMGKLLLNVNLVNVGRQRGECRREGRQTD